MTVTTPVPRVELFGIHVDALDMDRTVAAVGDMVRSRTPHQHVVVNAAKVVELSRNERLRAIIRGCDLVNADGAAVVMASRVLGHPLPERVTGIDLFVRLVAEAERQGWSVYFLGARADVVHGVVEVLTARHPGLVVAGARDGYWDDDTEVVDAVRAAAPDLLFLAIPSPRKEYWLSEHLDALGVPFVMGVGGSFDVVVGKVKRAPRLAQRLGLEWLWRLGQEPRRMWKRYLYGNSAFIVLTAKEWWTRRRGRGRR